ncbi:hypothetical protein EDEG_03470 [Edhazardia aedis USNM 41457]|uniref:Uncharacterized protein n=1 Tax=Edhazardia aedis (strain USNM 41457) TaxID=1003232 RepID=J9DHL1_EDHAE|nr:hypothetical protein EDEG_03470 [Edhazardia aedis USNM 41457]|eukprot:EJW02085.1 hypothetical protein EDEG_03470 [Edhazardia aedis USNM 41457]
MAGEINNNTKNTSNKKLLILVFTGFFILGFSTWGWYHCLSIDEEAHNAYSNFNSTIQDEKVLPLNGAREITSECIYRINYYKNENLFKYTVRTRGLDSAVFDRQKILINELVKHKKIERKDVISQRITDILDVEDEVLPEYDIRINKNIQYQTLISNKSLIDGLFGFFGDSEAKCLENACNAIFNAHVNFIDNNNKKSIVIMADSEKLHIIDIFMNDDNDASPQSLKLNSSVFNLNFGKKTAKSFNVLQYAVYTLIKTGYHKLQHE